MPDLGDPSAEDYARRFITLIDVLYESNKIFVCSSEVDFKLMFNKLQSSKVEQGGNAKKNDTDVTKVSISGEGGSSGRSTTMIGHIEWSATGLKGASLAKLASHQSFTKRASRRLVSRLLEMQSRAYIQKNVTAGHQILEILSQ